MFWKIFLAVRYHLFAKAGRVPALALLSGWVSFAAAVFRFRRTVVARVPSGGQSCPLPEGCSMTHSHLRRVLLVLALGFVPLLSGWGQAQAQDITATPVATGPNTAVVAFSAPVNVAAEGEPGFRTSAINPTLWRYDGNVLLQTTLVPNAAGTKVTFTFLNNAGEPNNIRALGTTLRLLSSGAVPRITAATGTRTVLPFVSNLFWPATADTTPVATIAAAAALTEATLDGATVTVTLQNSVYDEDIAADDFTLALTAGATGVSVSDVSRDSPTAATLTLAYDGTDITTAADLSVTVLAAAHVLIGDLLTDNVVTITPSDTATISAPPDTSIPIAETALGGTTLTVTLENTEYETSPTAGQFTLNLSAGTGVTVSNVARDSATAATLTLAYGGTGIDANTRIGVTVAGAAHTGAGDLTTDNMLRVAATAPSFAGMQPIANQTYLANSAITDLTLPAASGGEGALSYTLAPTGGGSLPNGLVFDADTRILSGTPDTEQAATGYTYTVTAGDGNTATLGFTIEVLNLATGLTAVRELAAPERRGRVVRIALTWLPPATVPAGTSVSSYEIQGCSAANTDCVAFITSNHIGAAGASQSATLFRATFNFYRVRARTAAGVSPWANVARTVDPGVVVDPGTLPSMVQNLASSARADNSVTLTWEAPTDAVSTAVNRYVVVRGFPAETATLGAFAPPGAEAVVTLADDVFTYADSGLLPGTEYLYEVFASSNAGDGEVAQLLVTTTGTLTTSIAGVATGAITEGATDSITGTLTITTTSGNSEFVAPVNSDGEEQLQFSTYGMFTISAAGVWTYSLNYNLPRVRALTEGQMEQDMFTVTAAAPTADGVAVTQVVTITITGVNTRPFAAIRLVEGSTVAAGETLRLESDITDPDNELDDLTIAWTAAGGIGTFSAAASADTDWMVPAATPPAEYLLTLTVTDPGSASDTEQVSITVTPPLPLEFGGETIDDQTYTMGAAITDLTLPVATGGTGPYSYALSGMPSGLAFDSDARVLSGTPDTVQAATSYTYTATDAATPPGTGTLAFTIEVAAPVPTVGGDLTGTATPLIIDVVGNTVSGGTASGTLVVSNVPAGETPSHRIETDAVFGELTVDSVTGAWSYQLDNSRTLTRSFGPTISTADPGGTIITTVGALEIPSMIRVNIGLGSFPDDPPTATAMVNGIDGGGTAEASTTVTLSGAGSDPEGSAITGYAWAQTGGTTVVLAPNANTAEVTFTAPASPETLAFTLTVMTATQTSPALSVAVEVTAAADLMPTFGSATIAPQTYTVGTDVSAILPAATDGDGALMYAITEALPDGLTFDGTSRALEGTPTTAQDVTTYTYTATDSDTTDPDTAALSFTIEIAAAALDFGGATIDDQTYTMDVGITDLTLPVVTGGTGPYSYALSDMPSGLVFDSDARVLSGTPDTAQVATTYTYTATDMASPPATVMQSFTIEVAAALGFGGVTIDDQTYTMDTGITDLTLPVATGGTGPYSYALSDMPSGLVFDSDARVLSGTPDTAQVATTYTYTATDMASPPATVMQSFTIEVASAATAATAAISASTPTTLTEANLNSATLTVTLTNTTYMDPLPANPVTLNTDATDAGVTVMTVVRDTATAATVTLDYDDTDFDADLDIIVTVAAAAHAGSGDLLTAARTVTAIDETSRLSALSLSEGALTPVFDVGIFVYAASVVNSIDGLTVTPTAAAGTTITVNSNTVNSGEASAELALSVGTNPITVTVTTPRADAQDYTLTVTREMAPTFGGTGTTGDVTEDNATETATGTLTVTNPNTGGSTEVVVQTDTDGTYGTFSIVAATGVWTYTLNNSAPATNALAAGETVTDVFLVVAAADPGATTEVTVTITGANDAPLADAGPDQPAVELSATVTLDGSGSADPDTGANVANADAIDTYAWTQSSGTSVSLSDTAVVRPTFTAPNSAATLVFSLVVNDGAANSAADTVTITVTDAPAATISATNPASLTEANLNDAMLTVTLANTTYQDPLPANSIMLNAEATTAGVTATAARVSTTEATLTLAFDRASSDFDTNLDITVTVLAAAHANAGDLDAGTVTATAINESDVATLSGLALSGSVPLNELFAPATLTYTADVANDVAEIMVTPTATDATGATITVNSDAVNSGAASVAIALTAGGATPITVVVTAEDRSTTQTYTLTVTRAAATTPSAAIASPDSLTEAALDGATVTVMLTNTEYVDTLAANLFTVTLSGGATGVSVNTAVRTSAVLATLTLAYGGTGIDTNTNLGIRVGAAGHSGAGNLDTATTIPVTATPPPGGALSFGGVTIDAQTYTANTAITDLTLPAATGGTGTLSYALSDVPSGLSFDGDTRVLSGTPDTEQMATTYTYTATDSAPSPGPAAVTLELVVTVGPAVTGGPLEGARSEAMEMTLGAFGRSFTSSAVEVLGERFSSGAGGSQLTFGGRTLSLESLTNDQAAAGAEPDNQPVSAATGGQQTSVGALFAGSAFQLSLNEGDAAGVGATTLWARGSVGNYEGEPEDGFQLDGDIVSGYLGLDYRANRRTLVGVAVSHSRGDADFSSAEIADGEVETELTSILPYVQWQARPGLSVWGLVGYGLGESEITDSGESRKTDVEMQTAALGARGKLWSKERMDVALKASALTVEIESDSEQNLSSVSTRAHRLRMALEGKRHGAVSAYGDHFNQRFELGLRWDGGDVETGAGADLGAGVEYAAPRSGTRLRLDGHYLLVHEESDFEEWEVSAAISIDPGVRGRGVTFALEPNWESTGARQRMVMDFTNVLGPAWRDDGLKLELYGERAEEHEFGLEGSFSY